jgi:hypothetical protein|tara:strand:+ start:590 stop:1690 length:1101 start_codon:yes stop_codon:yes gene_type:complete
MSYIGNKPATNFETVQKQISTSNSGTTITLDRAVTSVQDILLTIDAVVQSYDNYSVSGTTLTVGGTLSNNRVEILYVGRTMQSVDPTDDSVSAAKIKTDAVTTAKVQNDAITVDKLNLISTSSVPSLEAKGDGSSQDGYIQLNCSQNSHGVKIKSPPHSAGQSYTLTLPQSITNNTFLKTDGSGNLSFASAGGLVRLNGTTGSGLANITFDSIFSSTYEVYKIIGTHTMGSNNAETRMVLRKSSSDQEDSYRFAYTQATRTSSSGSSSDYSGWNSSILYLTDGSSYTASHTTAIDITVYAPKDATKNTIMDISTAFYKPSADKWHSFKGSVWVDGADGQNNDGFKIYPSTGTIDNAKYSIYGVVDS